MLKACDLVLSFQGLTAKSLLWISEETSDWDFWATLERLRFRDSIRWNKCIWYVHETLGAGVEYYGLGLECLLRAHVLQAWPQLMVLLGGGSNFTSGPSGKTWVTEGTLLKSIFCLWALSSSLSFLSLASTQQAALFHHSLPPWCSPSPQNQKQWRQPTADWNLIHCETK